MILRFIAFIGLTLFSILQLMAQETRLLRQPSLGVRTIAFTYGSDIWLSDLNGDKVTRITATPAVESNPVISPDGSLVAFTSNREGNSAVYVVSIGGGTPKRLTWHPAGATVVAWSPDGTEIIYASGRDYAPKPSQRLWKISKDGGNAQLVTSLRGVSASYSPDGSSIVVDVVSRWESEFRGYRGGQNTPLVVLNLQNESEVFIPNEHTIDIQPVWLDDKIYFLSDRQGGVANIWSFQVGDGALHQLTTFDGADVKWLAGRGEQLIFEREGRLHLFHLPSEKVTTLNIHVSGDFPWSEEQWEDVTDDVQFVSLSAKGKRVLMEARGDIFTIPTEYGDIRNITMSPLAADRKPIWSPSGDQIAWFSDEGHANYRLKRSTQDGIKTMADISLGESKYIWEPQWSPDEKYIAFVDDDLRIRLVDMEKGSIRTIGLGGLNIERGSMGLSWSPDSRWLAYSKSGSNNFQQIMVWSADSDSTVALTNEFANAFSATWDLDGKHLYFLGSTDVALGSGWTNTSAMNAEPEYAAYVVNLNASDPSPFELRSDEEKVSDETDKKEADDTEKKKESAGKKEEKLRVEINFVNIDRRIIPLPIPARDYAFVVSGPSGAVFIGERIPNERGMTIHKFTLKERESKEFADKVSRMEVSSDHEKILIQTQGKWNLSDTKGEKATLKPIAVKLDLKLNRSAEWKQMFEEAWRYEKDFFYDPGLHGRNWDEVYQRYAPLIPFVQHRADLNYIFDQMNGELSVGHSFVFGGDFPKVGESKVGLLGADLESASGGWMIKRIYTTENWNPELTSPLDQPGLKVQEGNFIVGVNGRPLSGTENLYERLDGTLDKQTTLHINEKPSFEGSWTIIVKPIGSEVNLRQRAWVEDNRKLVDRLSDGKLAYVWIPNTSGQGLVSFNRYFFAQQDRLGAVIDERYNGGGLLDDYMVDLMTRKVRAAYTNEVPGAAPKVMPAGILGPKVLLINEMSGSGGDFFPWVFRHQNAGPLIGTTTWGGLVKSSVHYRLVDGGALTAPDNAIFDPEKNEWIAENKGIAPDIEVRMDAKSLTQGKDPQLERAVQELLKVLDEGMLHIDRPPYSKPAMNKN